MDYRRMLGVTEMAQASQLGCDTKIAILDSGVPPIYLNGGYPSAVSIDGPNGRDEFGHATEVASLLFGCMDINGVCPNARPYYVKVLDEFGRGSAATVSKGIYQAIEWGADLINLSLGFVRTERCPRQLEEACRRAVESGATILCAAGNDGGRVGWPAALETTISVGSSGSDNLKASFSNHGEVDILAPGVNLCVRDADGVIHRVSGTSYSTALVTGISALMISEWRAKGVCFDKEVVLDGLKGLAKDIGDIGWDAESGFGVISATSRDVTVNQLTKTSFFDKIFSKIQGFLSFCKKGDQNGRV